LTTIEAETQPSPPYSVDYRQRGRLPSVVSLFSGAGGLDWGFRETGFKIPLAIDISEAAIRTHNLNFGAEVGICGDLNKLGPDGVGDLVRARVTLDRPLGIIGGPPCQGFSRANCNAQSNDPRNQFPKLYLRVIERLQREYSVEFIIFENVLGIQDRRHNRTYSEVVEGLARLGFDVTEQRLCALEHGVPQNRHRVVISAMRSDRGYGDIKPRKSRGRGSVREAIGHLPTPAFYARSLSASDIPVHPNHWTMNPKSPRFTNSLLMAIPSRSFRVAPWDKPSPTIAFGHREILVHPTGSRRLSIYEAMLLQGFPPTFVLEGNLSQQVEQVSNAVPPPMARSIAAAVKRSLLGQ
jgi:DNA (cytosine-5)-methyltransferase 1